MNLHIKRTSTRMSQRILSVLIIFWCWSITICGVIPETDVNNYWPPDEMVESNYKLDQNSDLLLDQLSGESNENVMEEPTKELSPQQINLLELQLLEVLQSPWDDLPIVYVEDSPMTNEISSPEDNISASKRSRYYRKYPWKRHHSQRLPFMTRSQPKPKVISGVTDGYDPENKYMCQPTREEVRLLLLALHDSRNGKDGTVSFCKRRRAAAAIYTNIRFLGRRRK